MFKLKLALLALVTLSSIANPVFAKTKFKSCVEGITGVGYVAEVKWYNAEKIEFPAPDSKHKHLHLGKPSKTAKTAVWETDCHTSSKPIFTTVRAIGNEIATYVVADIPAALAGAAAKSLCVGAAAGAAPATGGVSMGATAGCVVLGSGLAFGARTALRTQLPDPGTFFYGFAEHVEVDGTVWHPKAKITKHMKGLNEYHEVTLHGGTLEHGGTKNNIKVKIFNGDKLLREETLKGFPEAKNFVIGPSRSIDTDMPTKKVTHIEVSTDGDDAFWLDYLYLSTQWGGKIDQWGARGHAGWCLSTNKKDGESWKKAHIISKKAGCQEKWTFKYGHRDGYY